MLRDTLNLVCSTSRTSWNLKYKHCLWWLEPFTLNHAWHCLWFSFDAETEHEGGFSGPVSLWNILNKNHFKYFSLKNNGPEVWLDEQLRLCSSFSMMIGRQLNAPHFGNNFSLLLLWWVVLFYHCYQILWMCIDLSARGISSCVGKLHSLELTSLDMSLLFYLNVVQPPGVTSWTVLSLNLRFLWLEYKMI